jgi:long-chain acyl-CoA synthetase
MSKKKDVTLENRPWFKVWPAHLQKKFEYPNEPAWWILEQSAARFPDRVAIRFVNHENLSEIESISYGKLWERAKSLAAGLRGLGVKKGDRVAVLLPNSPAIIISYYGIWMAGASITPCNAMARDKEIAYQLKDSGAKTLIVADTLYDVAAPVADKLGVKIILAPVDEGPGKSAVSSAVQFQELVSSGKDRPSDFTIDPARDMAVLLYTGGTTGEPKGAILTHRNIVANTMQFAHWYDFQPDGETCICTIPMSHSGGMSGVMNVPLYAGATLITMKRFFPESVAKAIEKYRATRFFGVPTMYVAILNDENARKCNLTSLKACRTNAAPLPVAVKVAFDQMIGKEVLVEGYGLTETSPLTHANPLHKPKAGSIGIPLPDTDCKIIDIQTGEDVGIHGEGELLIRGPQVMTAYWNKPEATEKVMKDGWFHTGDVVRMDEEGYFYIIDRLKDMIICGGYKVWPREVEEVLYRHPKVRMAMVIGVPDDFYGEVPKAFIVMKEPSGTATPEEMRTFCKLTVAPYKMPRIIEFCESLPISPQGKVLRRVVREREKDAHQSSKKSSKK